MKSKKLIKVSPIALLVLALAGCGGRQDPYRVDTGSTPAVFNGLWDGLMAPFVFIKDVFGHGGYQLYTHGAGPMYWIGYIIGAVVIALILLNILVIILYRLRSFRRLP